MEWRKDEYILTDELERIDIGVVCLLLWSTYWAAKRSREIIEQSMGHSLNFGVLHEGTLVGFARVVSDFTTVSYLCDVIVAPEHRGRGLGKWMLQTILDHPRLLTTRMDLFTRDAQEFYRGFGFGKHKFECLVRYPPGYMGGSFTD
ncbi:MAG TPA: GNAT family N-acetyltransferase [Verrucomicrobiae bacterium]